jgi:hypothetical protein
MSLTKVSASMVDDLSVFNGDLSAAVTAIGSTTVQWIISSSTTLTSNVTIPDNISIIVYAGSVINTNGYDLTINGSFVAGSYPFFTGAGNVIFGSEREINAGWWTAWSTDAAVALTKAISSLAGIPSGSAPQVRTTGVGGKIQLPEGVATAYTSVNLASFTNQYLEIVGVSNSTIIDFNMTGANKLCFDCTGSNHITFRDFKIRGVEANPPTVGFYYARDVSSGSGLFHYMYDVISSGFFTKAVVYSYASEENNFYNCYFQQSANNSACYVNTIDNDGSGEDVLSVFTSTATGSQSNSGNNFFGCSFLQQGEGEFTDSIRLRGTYQSNFYGSFFASTGTSALQEVVITDSSCVEADGTYAIIFAGGGPTTPATGTYTIVSNVITAVAITNNGGGYSSQPTAATQSGDGILTPYAYGPRSYVCFDTSSPIGSLNVTIQGYRAEFPSTVRYGVFTLGTGTIANITFKDGASGAVLSPLRMTTGSSINNLVWENNVNGLTPKYGLQLANLAGAYIREPARIDLQGTTLTSVIFCNKSSLTVTGSVAQVTFIYTGEGTLQINGTPSASPAGNFNFGSAIQATVGANGAASALTANPLGYLIGYIGTTKIAIPYYNG